MIRNIIGEGANSSLHLTVTRRQAITGAALTLGTMASVSKVWGNTARQAAKGSSTATPNQERVSLHQEVDLKAGPQRIYETLLDAKQFAACTGIPAQIDPTAGGAFSMFGGMIVGRNIELVPNHRIVQAWRPTHWEQGIYSVVKFDLTPRASDTRIALDHTGFPEGEYDSLFPGWESHYWAPLKKFLA